MSIFGNLKTDVLDKLDKITWVSPDGDTLLDSDKKLVSDNGEFELSYNIEPMTSLHDKNVPFRAVIYVRHKGKNIMSWGCIDNKDNAEWLTWMIRKISSINSAQYREEEQIRKEGEKFWKEL